MSIKIEAGFEHLKEAMAEVFAKDVEFPVGMLVTVLGAKMTANQLNAKIILSVFPNNKQKEAMETLQLFEPEIKEGIAERLRLRKIPRLHYVFDTTEEIASGVEETLHELKEKGEI